MPNNQNPDEYSMQAINLFFEKFKSAHDIADATDFFTTQEIINDIHDILPDSELEANILMQLLIDKGYKFLPEPGKLSLHFKWLVKRLS
jgi:hypothetical protein